VRAFEKGKFELYEVGPATLGRATYESGLVGSGLSTSGPVTGETSCQVEQVGLVLSGQAVAKMDDGREVVMRAGDFFYVPPGHDSWAVGDEPYVSLHVLAASVTQPRSSQRHLPTASIGPNRPAFANRQASR
jgi:uncharacterized cupin superfamily protein